VIGVRVVLQSPVHLIEEYESLVRKIMHGNEIFISLSSISRAKGYITDVSEHDPKNSKVLKVEKML
jgi:hypothetical protein